MRSSGLVVLLFVLATACAREERCFVDLAAMSTLARSEAAAPLHAAALSESGIRSSRLKLGPYDASAWAISEGKRYFTWFNCSGCHAQGGGAFGPALMDRNWRYGSAPHQIYSSIVDGRAGGMPSFAGKLTEQEVWRLVAYVRALGGLLRFDVLPGRSDGLNGRQSEFMMQASQHAGGEP
jgi:cytochrome c oxidase cbb3-type subunit 3